MLKINDFLLVFSKKNKSKKIKFFRGSFKEINIQDKNENTFLIGYINNFVDYFDGEFVKIIKKNKNFEIINDYYASIPIYLYTSEKYIILTTSINLLKEEITDTTLKINEKNIYDYFSFGFMAATNDTIYENVSTINPNTKIVISDKVVSKENQILDISTFYDFKIPTIFQNNVNYKTSVIDKNLIFCLTSGMDSLIGGLSLKKSLKNFTTSTWGLNNSNDIIEARKRANLLNTIKHEEFIIENYEYKLRDFVNFSKITGGLSPLSSINLLGFTKFLVDKNFDHHIYCDFLEISRRNYNNLDEIQKKYLTPSPVIERYFSSTNGYQEAINSSTERILNSYDNLMFFYIFERCVKSSFYKNAILRYFNVTKVTLSLDIKFILNCIKFVSTGQKNYDNILNQLISPKDKNKIKLSSNKQFPFQAQSILKNSKEFFLDILSSNKNFFMGYFDMEIIINDINKDKYVNNNEWFIHRLLNLIIFNNGNKI